MSKEPEIYYLLIEFKEREKESVLRMLTSMGVAIESQPFKSRHGELMIEAAVPTKLRAKVAQIAGISSISLNQ